MSGCLAGVPLTFVDQLVTLIFCLLNNMTSKSMAVHFVHGFACSWMKKAVMMQSEQLQIRMIFCHLQLHRITDLSVTDHTHGCSEGCLRAPKSAILCFHWPPYYPHSVLFAVEVVKHFQEQVEDGHPEICRDKLLCLGAFFSFSSSLVPS